MLKDMYRAVTVSENWDNLRWFVPGDGGFMASEKPEWFSKIQKAVNYDGHSGSSYSWTMRWINYIAKHGWENFILKLSHPDEATEKRLREQELPYAIKEAEATALAWRTRRNNAESPEIKSRLNMRVIEAEEECVSLENELLLLWRLSTGGKCLRCRCQLNDLFGKIGMTHCNSCRLE
jgi:hypothetical protein